MQGSDLVEVVEDVGSGLQRVQKQLNCLRLPAAREN